jgi:hypothetical protein
LCLRIPGRIGAIILLSKKNCGIPYSFLPSLFFQALLFLSLITHDVSLFSIIGLYLKGEESGLDIQEYRNSYLKK